MSTDKKKKSGFSIFITLVLIVSVTGFWYFVIYGDNMPQQSELVENRYSIPSNSANISKVSININADIADFNVGLLSENSNKLIDADYKYSYFTSYRYNNDPVQILISNETVNTTLHMNIDITYNSKVNLGGIKEMEFNLLLNPNFEEYDLISNLDVGAFEMEAQNITFNDIKIDTSTGAINLNLQNVTIKEDFLLNTSVGGQKLVFEDILFENDLKISSKTGGIDLNFTNLLFLNNSTVEISTSTGGGQINWIQSKSFGSDVELIIESSIGGYDVNFLILDDLLRYEVILNSDVGSINFETDMEFDEIGENSYKSKNYESSNKDSLIIEASTEVGGIDLEIEQL